MDEIKAAKEELRARKAQGIDDSNSTKRILASIDKEYDNSVFLKNMKSSTDAAVNEMLKEVRTQTKKATTAEWISLAKTGASIFGNMLLNGSAARSATKAMTTMASVNTDYSKMSDEKLATELQSVKSDIIKYKADVTSASNAYDEAKGKKDAAEKAINGQDGTQAKVDMYNNKEDSHSKEITKLKEDITGYEKTKKDLNNNIKDYNGQISSLKSQLSGLNKDDPNYATTKQKIENQIAELNKKIEQAKADIKTAEENIDKANQDIADHEASYKQERADAINANNAKKEELENAKKDMDIQDNLKKANEKLLSEAQNNESKIIAEQNERLKPKKEEKKDK